MTEEILQRFCNHCKRTLSIESFQFKDKANGIRRTKCAECQNEYSRSHYINNKEYYLNRNRQQKKRNRQTVREYKENSPCTDCKGNFPYYVMEFDHREPELKSFNIGKTDWGNMRPINAELEKCDLVCANCHKKRTHIRRFGLEYA